MEKGVKVFIDGEPYVCTWSSDEMTDEDRYQSHMKTAEFMEQYGLSGDFQRALAQRYRPADA